MVLDLFDIRQIEDDKNIRHRNERSKTRDINQSPEWRYEPFVKRETKTISRNTKVHRK